MAIIEKHYDFQQGQDGLFNIDSYTNYPVLSSLEINSNNRIQFKNFSDNRNTDNFYGNGVDGAYQKRDTDAIRPKALYFYEVQEHSIHGWCLYKQWWSNGSGFVVGDEVILYKKHIENDDYLDELGQWEIVTITQVVTDINGTHYVIDRPPTYQWTTNTLNTATRIYQFVSLELFDNMRFTQEIACHSYIATPADLWNQRNVSTADGILFIKSQEDILIGDNASISCRYGYNGAYGYSNYYTVHEYCTGGAPMGSGTYNGVYSLNESIRDPRSPGCLRIKRSSGNTGTVNAMLSQSPNYGYNGGSPDGRNGVNHTAITSYSRKWDINSGDLNKKIFCGIGGTAYSVRHLNSNSPSYNTNYVYGYSGGGIVIIQTPKIIFKGENSHIGAYLGGNGARYVTGYANGGSILVKAEELVFQANPNQWQTYKEKTNTEIDYTNSNKAFAASSVYDTSRPLWVSNPGFIQLEFDRWKNEFDGTEFTHDLLTEQIKKDFIFDYKTEYVANLRDLNTLNEWSIDDSQKQHNFNHDAPKYETDKWYRVYSQGLNNLDIESWQDMVKLFTNWKKPLGTEIKIAFSTTLGTSWFYIDNIETIPNIAPMGINQTDWDSKGNTPEELDGFTASMFLSQTFVYSQASKDKKTIDIAIAFKTTRPHITPLFDYLWFDYNTRGILAAPIPMKPYNGEEFNNEFVNFVWLQASSAQGSVQNRIEISDIPNFEQSYKTVENSPSASSSTNGLIHIPFQGKEFDNKVNTVKHFKLPYMKKRKLPITVSGEENIASIIYENNTIKYGGGDVFFRKGSTLPLLSQTDLGVPTSKFTLENIAIPKISDLVSNFRFYGLPNKNKSTVINDVKTTKVFDYNKSTLSPNTILTQNILHGQTFTTLPSTNNDSGLVLEVDYTKKASLNILKLDQPSALMIRFIPGDLKLNLWNTVYSLVVNDTGGTFRWVQLVEIKPIMNGLEKAYIFRYYHATTEYNITRYGLEEQSENVIILNNKTNGMSDMYLNGIKIFDNKPRNSYNYYDVFDGVSPVRYRYCIGGRQIYGLSADGTPMDGQILEFAIWNNLLTDEEAKEVSKLSYWHLRYDFLGNKLKWKQVPYKDHLMKYKFVADEVDDFVNNLQNRFHLTNQQFALGDSTCYYNEHDTLLMGKYKPFKEESLAFEQVPQVHRPINGIPFLLNRKNNRAESYKNDYTYTDNNSLYQSNLLSTTEVLTGHHRFNPSNSNLSVTFQYNDVAVATVGIGEHIGIWSGAITPAENYASIYNRYAAFRKLGSNTVDFHFLIRHATNAITTVRNYVPLEHNLQDRTIYTLEMKASVSQNSTEVWLYSNTDENYVNGVQLIKPTDYTVNVVNAGFSSEDFNDSTVIWNAPFEEGGTVLRTTENSCFNLIDYSLADVNSVKTQEEGFKNRYDIYQNISSTNLKKINSLIYGNFNNFPGADLTTYVSFNAGNTWKSYDWATDAWVNSNPSLLNTGMNIDDASKLTTYEFSKTGGYVQGQDIVVRFVLSTISANGSVYVDKLKVSYNGPQIIDSWDIPGSFFNGTQFFQSQEGWSPYVEADFSDASQGWSLMGTNKPSPSLYTGDNGSRTSYADRKVFSGCRVLVEPKGKYYWRVASYNGV